MTETEGNSMFCGPETVDVSRGEAEGNIDSRGSTKHTAFPRSHSISILLSYQESKKQKKKRTSEEKTKKFLLNFVKTVKFNSVHNLNSEYKK